jgi:hypothetical protein
MPALSGRKQAAEEHVALNRARPDGRGNRHWHAMQASRLLKRLAW